MGINIRMFDCRAEQEKSETIPRDGPLISNHGGNLVGAIDIAPPSDFADLDMPGRIVVEIRPPWSQAHLDVVFPNGRPRNKISLMREHHLRAARPEAEYNHIVPYVQVRDESPSIFHIPIGTRGAPSRTSRAANPSRDGDDWGDCPSDGWCKFPGEDCGHRYNRKNKKNDASGNSPKSQTPPSVLPIPDPLQTEIPVTVKDETNPVTVITEKPPATVKTEPTPATVKPEAPPCPGRETSIDSAPPPPPEVLGAAGGVENTSSEVTVTDFCRVAKTPSANHGYR